MVWWHVSCVCAQGAGTKLGDIENVKVHIDKLNAGCEELKTLHRICYGRPGQKTTLKKTLREFSGLPEGEDVDKKSATVTKLECVALAHPPRPT
jgi:hypothetical protein